MAINKFQVAGNLSQNFEKKTDKFGILNLAFNTYNSQTRENEPTFVHIAVSGSEKQIEYLSNNATKGTYAVVSGSFNSHSYTDKQGNKVSTYQFNAFSSEVEIIKRSGSSQEPGIDQTNKKAKDGIDEVPTDIPNDTIDFDSLEF